MKIFYGVYLKQTAVSTILDIIRFLGEPDSIRFSHITLRGPYAAPLSKTKLDRLNARYGDETFVNLVEPLCFFSDRQSTVAIKIDLSSLQSLVYKPDFPNSIPHLTLYDGKDRYFASEMHRIVSQYDWRSPMKVGPVVKVGSKKTIEYEFLPFFEVFNAYYAELVGDPTRVGEVKYLGADSRLRVIDDILNRCTANPRHANQLTLGRRVASELCSAQ